ncbi:hypothetical protein [Corynebacterium ulcerans]|uniref:Uncharacterized protein n=2 Tax=Corynebacterium ulcerans TaxID=65058 RepID=A0ABD7MU29_CORUL|nr:hypothetical protein [Corynebacterium ulcerans]AEG80813.1 hypothetical protein CULC809_00273 [Corynebacterium ulcerans 809]AEG82993.1 hypothetical protein CULC22_00275 [Corynebacterium ulcerans BR-AD22]AIT88255.1 Hypothetical protein Cul210932_0287 [Corynebacterium ulcerans]AIU29643.1 Hypothetical protein Cul210931_0278 [Corynebacterium ulcerans]AIU90887.1 Hypothetical protein Cul05146_0295 [Corynebacterium ulcerans]
MASSRSQRSLPHNNKTYSATYIVAGVLHAISWIALVLVCIFAFKNGHFSEQLIGLSFIAVAATGIWVAICGVNRRRDN